ncbi:Protein kinase domain-containing protein [Desulfonema limicola]|uniref:Protein kinase domain-containing protein n=1 Tax=Desulfonema limicola TaxID=45656 RepID=A0A975B4M8_9BACT|nr:serine/threonine-protein kinase [Desulfonema limicola]QTA78697.1 Protein kinase domain-containing protein [Desulfonema limicola]
MNFPTAHFLPGSNKTLGEKYLLLECLGDGSHGWVYRAQRLADSAIVALKIPKQMTGDDRSLSEGKELIGIEHHPNVIQIFDMGRVPPEKEWFAIEMEYFPGESLAQKLEHRAHNFGNTFERLFKIFKQVLDAVAFLSNLPTPISHGDIKPHNILVGENDHVKLTDFGSSALPEEIYVKTRENGGTILYSAPEYSDCISRKGCFEELISGDIYSLGVLLYQLATGRLPHETQAQVRSHIPFPKPCELNSGICQALEQVILKCLEKYPIDRFAAIDDLKSAFIPASSEQLKFKPNEQIFVPQAGTEDWSVGVVSALENGNYMKAAKLAQAEYKRSGDANALLQQLNALYRAERWYDFEKVFNESKQSQSIENENYSTFLLLSIKVFMKIRNLEKAESLLNKAFEISEPTFELELLSASISGMQADYELAKQKLEKINKKWPGNFNVLKRLVQVSEQLRDYDGAATWLRAALRVCRADAGLQEKKKVYEQMGIW